MEDSSKKRPHWVLRLMGEAGLAVFLVLFCFVLFLVSTKRRFPIFDLMWPTSPSANSERSDTEIALATLTSVENEVRSKPSAEIIWSKASAGLKLSEYDSVQTLDNSNAVLTFDANRRMTMGANSLVVIKGLERGFIKKEKRPFVEIVSGSLYGNINATQAQDEKLEVVTPTSTTEFRAGGKGQSQASFRVNVRPDKTSNVTVYKGSATVRAQGVSVEVGENQTTQVGLTTPPTAPQLLPEPVSLLVPHDGVVYVRKDTAPEIALTWDPPKEAGSYRLQVSNRPEVTSPFIDEILPGPERHLSGLEAGVYYWRVAASDVHGIEGNWSLIRRLEVIHPVFKISFPEEAQVFDAEHLWVEGESAPTDTVYLNGIRVTVNERGLFREQVFLTQGKNLIVAEAIDPLGASLFQTRTITREP